MLWNYIGFAAVVGWVLASGNMYGEPITGSYIEVRTCQVYTGPCFANGEVGLGGKNAVMSWKISKGKHQGVDLAGTSVMVVVRASDTLGFQGLNDASELKSMIVFDDTASKDQRDALVTFAKTHSGRAGQNVAKIQSASFSMNLDRESLTGELEVGKLVKIKARKARPGDCICSNESAYYPPLVTLEGCVPGVTIQGDVRARCLGASWTIPDSRTAYLGTFSYDAHELPSSPKVALSKSKVDR